MMDCFSFRFNEDDSSRASLCLFLSSAISSDVILKVIKEYVEENIVPKNVFIISFSENILKISDLIKDEAFRNEFYSFVGDVEERLILLTADSNGDISVNGVVGLVDENFRRNILDSGMIEIFRNRKGLVESSESYHFIKPSGDHCKHFIRASNLLASGIEVSFLSISILKFLTSDIKRIYVDSSSISYLISSAVGLSGKFINAMPMIESFESYAVFNKKFDFIEGDESLVFISATTSGSLKRKIIGKFKKIITLFHIGSPYKEDNLFDLSNELSSRKIISYKPVDCIYCENQLTKIRIVGDHFLPEVPNYNLLLIRKNDFPESMNDFYIDYASKGLLRWNVANENRSDDVEHFFFDLANLEKIEHGNFLEAFSKKVNDSFHDGIGAVVSLDDSGSKAFSRMVKKLYEFKLKNCTWISISDIDDTSPLLKSDRAILVLAGAITSGRKLLDISRKFRGIIKPANITYIIGFSKVSESSDRSQLEKDLMQGGHKFFSIYECTLPRISRRIKSAWDSELEKLEVYEDEFNDEKDLPVALKERLVCLRSNSDQSNNMFLMTPMDTKLKLRPSFAFWSALNIDTAMSTHSDVYWTIQMVLHNLRSKTGYQSLANIYHNTMINPTCFDRYNDGVIQACLLRAAKPSELNYSVDEKFSQRMMDFVMSAVNSYMKDEGEAALEFLMAIWTNRMKLLPDHISEISKMDDGNFPAVISFMLSEISK